MSGLDLKSVKMKMESWCAYQDRSIAEATQKLSGFGLSGSSVSKIISDLKKERFLDDKRFTESFVQGKFRIKGWGKNKIKSHLIQKHRISVDLISEAFAELPNEEYEAEIKRLILKKFEELKKDLPFPKKKEKVIRFLLSRGYAISQIFEQLNKLNFNGDD